MKACELDLCVSLAFSLRYAGPHTLARLGLLPTNKSSATYATSSITCSSRLVGRD